MRKLFILLIALCFIGVGIYFYFTTWEANPSQDPINEASSYPVISYDHYYDSIKNQSAASGNLKAKPFGCEEAQVLASYFNHAYLVGGINPNATNVINLIDLSTFLNTIDYPSIANDPIKGFSFIPVLTTTNTISFALVKAEKTPTEIIHRGNAAGMIEYYLIENNNLNPITVEYLNTMRQNYNNLLVRSKDGVNVMQIGMLNHPGDCFYKGIELDSFLVHNGVSAMNTKYSDKMEIEISNVGQDVTGVISEADPTIFSLQSTLMTLYRNDIVQCNNIPNINTPKYFMKSMDYGQLCPPNCK